MHIPETSSLFTRWKNPSNGIESLVLTERAAPVQQSFYYTHPSFSADGRFLWLGCGFPPPGGMHAQQVLGVVDFVTNELRVYPETQFGSARPWLDHATGEVYWGAHLDVWKRGPLPDDTPVRVNTFPAALAKGLRLHNLSTHSTFSSDGRSFNIDARFFKHDGTPVSYIGDMPLDGSPFQLWQRTEGFNYDHGLFSPIDPDVQLFAHEFWSDGQRTGLPFDGNRPYHRIWLIRRGEKAAPLLQTPVSHSGHEWWDADGQHIWYLHYGVGVKKVSLATREETLVWPGALSHAHSSQCGRYLVADRMDDPGNADCHVLFRDTVTGKEVEIVNRGPLAPHLTKCTHLHPHPHFCLNDRYICYTTTVHDQVDVALVGTDDLIRRTA
jgi:hypothetical protein